jgi:hypothetical protein
VHGKESRPESQHPPGPKAAQRYQANGMVLQKQGGKAMLCLGAIATSLPPQCGDVPITNWDWESVEGAERMSGVTWGSYHVMGTYDGTAFTVLEVGRPGREPEDPLDEMFDAIEVPCPEPGGGWVASDPHRASEADMDAAGRLAESRPDFAGLWVKILNQPPDVDVYGPDDVVLNVAFTGDLERHRAELTGVWGGPICVVQHQRTQAELRQIQDELSNRGPDEFGFQLLAASADVVRNQVVIAVVALDDEMHSAIDDRYGPGTVRLIAALKPVP